MALHSSQRPRDGIAHTHIVQKLLQIGASIDVATSERNLTPLHLAAEHGCQSAVDVLLSAGANPHARSTSLTTPFYRAARGGDTYIMAKLKERGCDVHGRTWDNWTPLHEAAGNGFKEATNPVLERGADPMAVTDHGYVAGEVLNGDGVIF